MKYPYIAEYSKMAHCLHYYLLLFSCRLSMTLNNTDDGYLLSKETPIDHVLFMDDLKFYDKTERELQSLVHTVRAISKYIGLEWKNTVLFV